MSDQTGSNGSFVNSVIGEGTNFRGKLELRGLLRIDGDFSGTIETPDKVLVGKNGRVDCSIKAGSIVVGGVVKGDIQAVDKITILSTGVVLGNIAAARLVVEEGVILHGHCVVKAGAVKKTGLDKWTQISEQTEQELSAT